MRNIVLITILLALSGCTVSARNHHFELVDYSSKYYDDFQNIWCFSGGSKESIQVCSAPYKRRSENIGFLLPVFPQFDRESRLAYDTHRPRMIEFKSIKESGNLSLSDLNGIEKCSSRYAKKCISRETITVDHSSSIWLKIPEGEQHEFLVSTESVTFKVVIKEFNEVRWHAVTV